MILAPIHGYLRSFRRRTPERGSASAILRES
jgi:hypothetical protein